MDAEFEKKYRRLSAKHALTWPLKKDEILNDTVEGIYEKYKLSPSDASILNVCITVMALRQANMKVGRRG